MSVSMKDPSHALLTGGVLAAAILAVVGGFLFFANVPEPGAAREQIIAAAPPMNRADIDRIIAERNALAPRPSAVARAESAAGALRSREELAALPLEPMADAAMAAESVETARGRVPGPVETAPADDGAPKSKKTVAASGEALFAEGKYEEALGVWRAAALSGDRVAAYDLGLVYLDSQVSAVPRDATEAAKWLRMAAAAKHPVTIEAFCNGDLEGWGLTESRLGNITQFRITAHGNWDPKQRTLTLNEAYQFEDGRIDKLAWIIHKQSSRNYVGSEDRLIGEAKGQHMKKLFLLRYKRDVPGQGQKSTKLSFKDRFFLFSPKLMLVRASVRKFGIEIAQMTVVYQKL